MKTTDKYKIMERHQSQRLKNILMLSSLLSMMLIFSCGPSSDGGFHQEDEAKIATQKGTSALKSGDYEIAAEHFKRAIASAKSNLLRSTGHVGLGYSQFRSSESNLDEASKNFNQALSIEKGNNDARSGLAFINFAKNSLDSTKIIAVAMEVLKSDSDPKFKMSLDSKIDYNDLWLLIALTRFYNENYTASLVATQHVDKQSLFVVQANTAKGQQDLADRIELLLLNHRQ